MWQCPTGNASPCAVNAAASTPFFAAGSTSATFASASIAIRSIAPRSSTIPSCNAIPEKLCPLPRGLTFNPLRAA